MEYPLQKGWSESAAQNAGGFQKCRVYLACRPGLSVLFEVFSDQRQNYQAIQLVYGV